MMTGGFWVNFASYNALFLSIHVKNASLKKIVKIASIKKIIRAKYYSY